MTSVMCLAACQKDNSTTVSPKSIEFPSDGGTAQISINDSGFPNVCSVIEYNETCGIYYNVNLGTSEKTYGSLTLKVSGQNVCLSVGKTVKARSWKVNLMVNDTVESVSVTQLGE